MIMAVARSSSIICSALHLLFPSGVHIPPSPWSDLSDQEHCCRLSLQPFSAASPGSLGRKWPSPEPEVTDFPVELLPKRSCSRFSHQMMEAPPESPLPLADSVALPVCPVPPFSSPSAASLQQASLQELVVTSPSWWAYLLDLFHPEPASPVESRAKP